MEALEELNKAIDRIYEIKEKRGQTMAKRM